MVGLEILNKNLSFINNIRKYQLNIILFLFYLYINALKNYYYII